MDFVTVYEYHPHSSNVLALLPILLFLMVGIAFVVGVKKVFTKYSIFRQVILFFGYVFSFIAGTFLILTLVKSPSIIKDERQFNDILKNKTYNVIEGEIQAFSPMPVNKPGHESFLLRGVKFSYSDYVVIDGFHQTSAAGGPIKANGQIVRISYITVDDINLIVKLEVKK